MTKKMYVKISRPETHGNSYRVWPYSTFSHEDEMDGMEVGEKIVCELIELTDEEFTDLGEFDGW